MITVIKVKSPVVTANASVRRIVTVDLQIRRGPPGLPGKTGEPGPPGNLENMSNINMTGGFF